MVCGVVETGQQDVIAFVEEDWISQSRGCKVNAKSASQSSTCTSIQTVPTVRTTHLFPGSEHDGLGQGGPHESCVDDAKPTDFARLPSG